ncbi:MAG: ACT domain-containing protein, partial [Acidimicrobiales bacterium]|nr:ACT domain-containing protein [Acidimicrobiales bacterium]
MRTVLVRISGPDQLGISAELFGVLAGMNAIVRDIEQIVVRRRLTLDVLIEVEKGDDVLKDLLLFGFKRDLKIDVEEVEDDPTEYSQQFVVTLIGEELTPIELNKATVAITSGNGNIDRIVRLSTYPVMSYELSVNGGDIGRIRENLLSVASILPKMDVAIQPLNLSRRAKRLVVLDVDSTLIQDEVIDLLAAQAGCEREVSEITESAMQGKL